MEEQHNCSSIWNFYKVSASKSAKNLSKFGMMTILVRRFLDILSFESFSTKGK